MLRCARKEWPAEHNEMRQLVAACLAMEPQARPLFDSVAAAIGEMVQQLREKAAAARGPPLSPQKMGALSSMGRQNSIDKAHKALSLHAPAPPLAPTPPRAPTGVGAAQMEAARAPHRIASLGARQLSADAPTPPPGAAAAWGRRPTPPAGGARVAVDTTTGEAARLEARRRVQ